MTTVFMTPGIGPLFKTINDVASGIHSRSS
jgi:hypothetical protein